MTAAAHRLDQIFPGILPGPAIREETITPRTARTLPPDLQEAYGIATQEGVAVKLVTCRLLGIPARNDGSHEVRMILPLSRNVPLAGTTV